jgi:tetratricopeptide (TPR) repeat protein
LAALVNKSLLRVISPGRYDMLEPLKQYAADKLTGVSIEDGMTQNQHCDDYATLPNEIHQRHATYYLSLAEQAERALKGSEQLVWLGRMETEYDNLRAALSWMLTGQNSRTILGLQLAGTLGIFWQISGHHWSEGSQWLQAALENADGHHPADSQYLSKDASSNSWWAKALLALGSLLHHQWRFEQAAPFFHKSLALYQEMADEDGMADAFYWLGCHAFRQKAYAEATQLLEQSLALYQGGNNQYGISMALAHLGDCARLLKDYDRSTTLYEQGLTLSRQIGNKRGAGNTLNSLGELARLQGNLRKAKAFYEEGLSLNRESGNEVSQAITLHNLGHTILRLGDVLEARTLFKEGLALFQKLEHTRGITLCLAGLAGVASSTGQAEQAARLLAWVKTALQASNAPLPLGPADQAAYDRYLVATKAQLDPLAFDAAWEAGRRMMLSQAVDCAMELL